MTESPARTVTAGFAPSSGYIPPTPLAARAKWFALAALTVTFSVGFIDRQILNLLVQPIKADFGLSDLEISLLQGAAFSLTYLIMSPIFGRMVDVSPRRRILLGCIALWSLFTAACGLARSYLSLFAMRSGVGAAEAGLTPSAWSMLSDIFDGDELARALSIYNLGPYIGNGMALLLGGVLLEWTGSLDVASVPLLSAFKPWQLTFLIVSLLGALALAMVAALREPARRAPDGVAAETMSLQQTREVLVRHRRFYLSFYIGMALANIPVYAFPAWLPALAVRQYGIPISHVGLTYGIVTLVCGSVGVLSGPSIGRWLERMGFPDANMRVALFGGLAVTACCIALFFRTSYTMVLSIGGIASFCYSLPTPLAATALQLATPPRMRGVASAIYIVMVTIMGLGIAPIGVALLTDVVFADEMRVGDSLAIMGSAMALASCLALAFSLKGYRDLIGVSPGTTSAETRFARHAEATSGQDTR